MWHQHLSESLTVARCTVARLIKHLGIADIRQGRRIKTTMASNEPHKAKDKVQRAFNTVAPNLVWVADITYIRIKQHWLYLAIVIDLYSH